MRTLVAAGSIVLLGAAGGLAEPTARSRWFTLVALPSLGTVTWRCEGPKGQLVALGFRVTPNGADTYVIEGMRRVHLVPPRGAARFPGFASGTKKLQITQGNEARTLVADVGVTVDPGRDYCFSYFPPAFTIRLRYAR